MKKSIVFCFMLVILLPTLALAALTPARISMLSGETSIKSPETEDWLAASVNTPLDEGDSIWVPNGSRTEVQLPDGSLLRLDGGSQLDVIANEDGFLHLHLDSGRLYLKTIQGMQDNSVQIDADDTTVLPAGRTRLRVDMLPGNLEDVAILKGSAYVEGSGSRTRVRAGEHIMMEEQRAEIHPLNPADSWELWNLDRDRDLSRAAKSGKYLPEELRPYSSELDASGTWVSVPEYGMVWRPTVIVADEWAPYSDGRWIWKGDDYVWISYETWGWVPYHYGRWAVFAGFGWCWVPPVRGDVYWGPGYVGWYRTGSYVGWTPLAPGETFYGRRYYGRHSVNITTVNVNITNISYRNRQHRGGFIVQTNDNFLHGRYETPRAGVRVPDSIAVSAGSPRIQPVRETRMPVIKQTPPRPAPPEAERRDNRDLKERFPRIKPEEKRRQPFREGIGTTPKPPTIPSQQPPRREERESGRSFEKGQGRNPAATPAPAVENPRIDGRTGEKGYRTPITGGKDSRQPQPLQGQNRQTSERPQGTSQQTEERHRLNSQTKSSGQSLPAVVTPRNDEQRMQQPSPATSATPRYERQTVIAPSSGDKSKPAYQAPRQEQPRKNSPIEPNSRQIWRVMTPEPAAPAASGTPQEREQGNRGRGREFR